MLADTAIHRDGEDRLRFTAYANALAALIDNPATGTPLTLAINAPWGSGKSSLGHMVRSRLEGKAAAGGDQPHVTTWFDAWMHDDAEHLASAFAAHVAHAAAQRRSFFYRVTLPIPPDLRAPSERRKRRVAVVLTIVALALVASAAIVWQVPAQALGRLLGPSIQAFLSQSFGGLPVLGITVFLVIATALGLLRGIAEIAKTVRDFVQDPEGAAATGSMPQVREELAALIHQATPRGSRFVIFVDDLERCRPPGAVDLLEVVNQLLPRGDVVTVIMADMPAVGASAAIKYEKLASQYRPNSGVVDFEQDGIDQARAYGRLYLQKIVQLQFDLPVPALGPMREFVASLVEPATGGPADEEPEPPRLTLWRFVRLLSMGLWFHLPGHRSDLDRLRLTAARYHRRGSLLGGLLDVLLTDPARLAGRLADRLVKRASLRLRTPDRFRAARGLLLLAGMWSAILLFQNPGDRPQWWPAIPAAAAIAAIALAVFDLNHRRKEVRVTRELRRFFDQQIRQLKARGGRIEKASQAELLDAARRRFPDVQHGLEALLEERVRLHLTSQSQLLAEAQGEMMRFLPPLPRSAKRLVNHLRLLLVIAYERSLFIGPASLSPGHVGKWVVLRERWPDLAQALVATPSAMQGLERHAANKRAFVNALHRIAPACAPEDALRDFCRTGVPLAAGLERLVRFDPPTPG